MSVLLVTGAGLGIGSCISWLVERKPYLVSDSIPDETDSRLSFFSVLTSLTIIFMGCVFFVLSIWDFSTVEALIYASFLSLISAVAVFDIKYRKIPNRLILMGISIWGIFVLTDIMAFTGSLLAGISAALTLLLVRWLGFWLYQKAGMGMGDVKFLFVMGLFLEWEVFWVLYLAILTGGLWSCIGLGLKKIDKSSRLPFVPFLLVGSLLAIFLLSFTRLLALWI